MHGVEVTVPAIVTTEASLMMHQDALLRKNVRNCFLFFFGGGRRYRKGRM